MKLIQFFCFPNLSIVYANCQCRMLRKFIVHPLRGLKGWGVALIGATWVCALVSFCPNMVTEKIGRLQTGGDQGGIWPRCFDLLPRWAEGDSAAGWGGARTGTNTWRLPYRQRLLAERLHHYYIGDDEQVQRVNSLLDNLVTNYRITCIICIIGFIFGVRLQ